MTSVAFHLPVLIASWVLLAAGSAAGGTVYWNMSDLSAPTLKTVSNLAVGAIGQGNTTTTGTASTSSSSGYTFFLAETSTPASGGANLTFAAKHGVLSTASSSYMAVTFTPSIGSTGTVTGIGFASRSTSSGPTTLSLRSSNDAFAAEIAGFTTSTTSTWAYFTQTFSTPLIIDSGSSLELRLYGSGGSSANGGNWRLDDLQFDALVVPEPATLLLGLVGAVGLMTAGFRLGNLTRRDTTRCAEHKPGSASSSCSS
ncbi:MAG: hypothetical protein ACKOCX_06835 [Planctomycetota bacterium]